MNFNKRYNTAKNETTGESPHFLLYGRDPKIPECEDKEPVKLYYLDSDEYKHKLVQELENAYEIVRERTKKEQKRYKEQFDERNKVDKIKFPEKGDRVLLRIPLEKAGSKHPKLVNEYQGPFRVVGKSETAVEIKPVIGQGEILRVPMEQVRLVPKEYLDEPCVTKKSCGKRGRKKKVIEEQAQVSVDALKIGNKNSENAVDCDKIEISRIECPCIPNKCQFVINSGRWSLTTTSLEETAAINELMIRHPLMKPKEVKAAATLKLVQISIESKKEAIKMGASCPNVENLAKRIGWEKELEMVKKELAKLVEPPRKVLKHQHLIATFGELPADAPKHVIQIKEGIAENFGRKYQLIGTEMVLVLAKSTPQQSMFEDVRKLVMGWRNLKSKVKIVILPLPLEGSLEDMLEIEKFSRICSGMPEVSYIQANKKSENRGLPVCVLADVKKTSTWTGLKEYLKMVMMDNEVKEEMEENMWRMTLKSLDDGREGEPEMKKARK